MPAGPERIKTIVDAIKEHATSREQSVTSTDLEAVVNFPFGKTGQSAVAAVLTDAYRSDKHLHREWRKRSFHYWYDENVSHGPLAPAFRKSSKKEPKVTISINDLNRAVRDTYTQSGKTDEQFAEAMGATADMVAEARALFGDIPANAPRELTIIERVQYLEAIVALMLEGRHPNQYASDISEGKHVVDRNKRMELMRKAAALHSQQGRK